MILEGLLAFTETTDPQEIFPSSAGGAGDVWCFDATHFRYAR